MEKIKNTASTLESKYEEWSKVLIEPAALNDARLYSLEARTESEEKMRFEEFQTLKEHLLKIIYSFVQNSQLKASNREDNYTPETKSYNNSGSTLPNIL